MTSTATDGDRHLIRAAVTLLLTTGGTAILGIVGLIFTAKWYSPVEVGRGTALVQALLMLSVIAQLNLANGLPKFLAHSGARTMRLLQLCYVIPAVAGALLALVFVLVAPHVSDSYAFLHPASLSAALLILGTAGWAVFSLQDAVLTGLRATQWVLVENIAFGAVKLLALAVLATSFPHTGIMMAWVLPMIVSLVPVNLLIFGTLAGPHARQTADGPTLTAAEVKSFVGWDFIGSLFSQLYTALIPLLVFSRYGAETAAPFAVSWSVAINLDMVAHNLASSLTVEGSRAPHRVAAYTRRMLAIGTALILTSTAAVWLLGALIPRILGPEYDGVTDYLPLLVLANLPRLVIYLYQGRLRAVGQAKRLAISQAVVAAITVTAAGVAMATIDTPRAIAWVSCIGPAIAAVAVAPAASGGRHRAGLSVNRLRPARRSRQRTPHQPPDGL